VTLLFFFKTSNSSQNNVQATTNQLRTFKVDDSDTWVGIKNTSEKFDFREFLHEKIVVWRTFFAGVTIPNFIHSRGLFVVVEFPPKMMETIWPKFLVLTSQKQLDFLFAQEVYLSHLIIST
jgi:hypothetical protein